MPTIESKTQADDFKNLVDLMSIYAEATLRLGDLQTAANTALIDVADEHKDEYAEYQAKITEAESAIELIARRNPAWFADARSVKTPYGTVAFRSASKLEVPNEELTVVLIEQRIAEELAADAENDPPSAALLRTRKELNLEALEQLDDRELKTLRVARVTSDSFSVKPLKVDLGKAVKAAAEKAAPAAPAGKGRR